METMGTGENLAVSSCSTSERKNSSSPAGLTAESINTKDKIKQMLSEGKRPAEIARLLNISRQAVHHHIKQTHIKNSKNKNNRQKAVINWRVYNEALVMRGEFLFNLDLLAEEKVILNEMNMNKVGGRFKYSNALIEIAYTLKIAFHTDYRTLEGILRKLLPILFNLNVPNYSTLCRRVETLPSELKTFVQQPEQEIVNDSSGRAQSVRGFYRENKYNTPSRKFLKVHISLNPNTKEVQAEKVTEGNVADIKEAPKLISEANTRSKVTRVYGDPAYDSDQHRGDLIKEGIVPVIKPKKLRTTIEKAIQKYNELYEQVKAQGIDKTPNKVLGKLQRLKSAIDCASDYEKWRDENHYGKRALVENWFSRDTRFFGDRVCSKKLKKAEIEMSIRATFLNLAITLARAKSKVELKSVSNYLKEELQRHRLKLYRSRNSSKAVSQ